MKFTILFLGLWYSVAEAEKIVMKVPVLVAITGAEPKTGETCIDSTKLLADLWNEKAAQAPKDDVFMQKYHIEPIFLDEAGGNRAAFQVIRFYYFEEYKRLGRQYAPDVAVMPSPVIAGAHFSTACKAIGTFLHLLGLVDVSTGCGAPFMIDHYKLPNVYMTIARNDEAMIANLRFFRDVGRWNRFGIVFNVGTINDYLTGIAFDQMSRELGFQVPYFELVLQVNDELIDRLVQSELRIFAFFFIDTVNHQFLCRAHKAGLTGPKYTFISGWTRFVDPTLIPEQFAMPPDGSICQRSVVIEQMKYTFWAGQMLEPDEMDENTKLRATIINLNSMEFEKLLNARTNNSRPADYQNRFLCPDVLLRSLIAMRDAENLLQKQNSSLSEFLNEPLSVGNVVNRSVADHRLIGLRVGHMSYEPKNLQPVGEIYAIGRWTPADRMRVLMTVKPKTGVRNISIANLNVAAYDDSFVQHLRQMRWPTVDGQPQKDAVELRQLINRVPTNIFIAIATISGCFSAVKSGVFVNDFLKAKTQFGRWKTLGYWGGIVLNIAAILLVAEFGTINDVQAWIARIIAIVVGLTLSHVVSFVRLFGIELLREEYGQSLNIPQTSYVANLGKSKQNLNSAAKRTFRKAVSKKFLAVLNLSFVSANLLALAIWLAADPPSCSLVSSASVYSPVDEALTTTYQSACSSMNMVAWCFALVCLHAMFLLAALFSGIQSSKIEMIRQLPEFNYARLAVANSLTILFAIILAVFLVAQQPVNLQITLAAGCIISAAQAAATLTVSTLSGRKLAAMNNIQGSSLRQPASTTAMAQNN